MPPNRNEVKAGWQIDGRDESKARTEATSRPGLPNVKSVALDAIEFSPPSKTTRKGGNKAHGAFVADCRARIHDIHRGPKNRGYRRSASPKGGQIVTEEEIQHRFRNPCHRDQISFSWNFPGIASVDSSGCPSFSPSSPGCPVVRVPQSKAYSSRHTSLPPASIDLQGSIAC